MIVPATKPLPECAEAAIETAIETAIDEAADDDPVVLGGTTTSRTRSGVSATGGCRTLASTTAASSPQEFVLNFVTITQE